MTQSEPITRDIIEAFLFLMDEVSFADLTEVSGGDPLAHIVNVAARSVHTYAGMIDGAPAFIGGVLGDGQVWMLGNPLIAKCRKFYLRETRRQRDIMAGLFPVLRTQVDVNYPRSLRWLEWLGFAIGEPVSFGIRVVRPVEFARV